LFPDYAERAKVGLLELAKWLGNISRACKMMAWLGMLCTIGKDACSSNGDGADGQGSEHHGALLDNFGWEAISAVQILVTLDVCG
jgi:hypothetical protein